MEKRGSMRARLQLPPLVALPIGVEDKAALVDAAKAYEAHLAKGGKMFLTLAGAMMMILGHALIVAQTQPSPDVLGMHNMTPASGSGVKYQGALGCTFCHAPHSGSSGNGQARTGGSASSTSPDYS